jgi:hypothetical protein
MLKVEEQFQLEITDTQADQDLLGQAAKGQVLKDQEPQELLDLRGIP